MDHAHHTHHEMMIQDFKKRFWICLVLSLPVFLLSGPSHHMMGLGVFLHFPGSDILLLSLSSFLFFYGGRPFLEGLAQEILDKRPGMMTLVGVAISVAYFYSLLVLFTHTGTLFWGELVTLIDIMLLGHWVEMKSIMGAGSALASLARLLPESAHKIVSTGETRDVPLVTLQKGDTCLVKPGERVPADGRILEGTSALDESMLTGEFFPVVKGVGDKVIGGSLNTDGALVILLEKLGHDTFLSHISTLVQEAQTSTSKTQTLAGRAAGLLTYVAFISGLLTFLFWSNQSGLPMTFALERAVTVMVITCPHALGLAMPLVVAVSTSMATKRGLLIRNRTAFEEARHINTLLFDKTGTLTMGVFVVRSAVSLDPTLSSNDLLAYAAAVESASVHPIAKGIIAASNERWEVKDARLMPGEGAQGVVKGQDVKVVSPDYVTRARLSFDAQKVETMVQDGETLVFVLIDGAPKGLITLSDSLRPEAQDAIHGLHGLGIACYMMTGDTPQAAKGMCDRLKLDGCFSHMRPAQKIAKVEELQNLAQTVAMVGDGVNDAPALAKADVGIAIGAGTDVAMDSAHITLVHSNLQDVVTLIQLARATYGKMRQNLVWATAYNLVAIPMAAGLFIPWGLTLSPAVGAVLMSLSTLICALNARLLKL